MLGLVDAVDRVADFGGARTGLTLSIRGRDLGKLLVQDDLIHAAVTVDSYQDFRQKITAGLGADHPLLTDLQGTWGPRGRDGTPAFEGKGVAEVVDFILQHAGSIRLPALAAATGTTGSAAAVITTDRSITTWDSDTVYSDRPMFYQGDLWSYLWTVLDRDFYEARVDCRPERGRESAVPRVELVIRPKPFDEDLATWASVPDATGIGWHDLTTYVSGERYHTVELPEVFSLQLGVSDAEAVSHYVVTSEHDLIGNPSSMAEGLSYPLVDTFAARRFGLRTLGAQLSLVSGDYRRKVEEAGAEDTGQVAEQVRVKRDRLFNWYRPLPWYESGAITVAGRDSFRVGDRIYLPWLYPRLVPAGQREDAGGGLHFYVASVTWSWTYGENYRCTLQVQRGHNNAMLQAIGDLIRDDAPASNPSHYAAT